MQSNNIFEKKILIIRGVGGRELLLQREEEALRRAKAGEVTLDLQWDDLPDESAISESQLAAVTAWLAAPAKVRPDTLPGEWAKGDLSKDDAKKALHLIWLDYRERLSKERKAEIEAKMIQLGDKKLRYLEKVFGNAPEGGR